MKNDHNMWKYIYFSIYLDTIDTSDHNAIEKYAYEMVSDLYCHNNNILPHSSHVYRLIKEILNSFQYLKLSVWRLKKMKLLNNSMLSGIWLHLFYRDSKKR